MEPKSLHLKMVRFERRKGLERDEYQIVLHPDDFHMLRLALNWEIDWIEPDEDEEVATFLGAGIRVDPQVPPFCVAFVLKPVYDISPTIIEQIEEGNEDEEAALLEGM